MKRSRRFGVLLLVSSLACLLISLMGGCGDQGPPSGAANRLTVGWVSRDTEGALEKYAPLRDYLASQLQTNVELEPAFNELRAVEQVKSRAWSLVFAPSGLAAVALSEAQYVPLLPLQGIPNQRSLLVVRADSPYETLADLANEPLALGEPGSATGYYLPLYDLYGLTLESVRFAPTAQQVLAWLQAEEVAAGALSEVEFQAYRKDFSDTSFRVLHKSRVVPPGAVLLSPTVERNQQRLIETALKAAPPNIVADAGYIPNAAPPDFSQLIQLVEKVRPLTDNVKDTPAVLTVETDVTDSESAE